MNIDRRKLLVSSALSFGSVSLRSLVTGLPAAFIMGGAHRAMAQSSGAKYLIVSHLRSADPINTNVPGCYGDPNNSEDILNGIAHPTTAEAGIAAEGYEQGVLFNLGGTSVRGAAPWAQLPADLRSRMAFWHQATFVSAHPDFASVRRFNGSIKGQDSSGSDELDALIAQELYSDLNSLTAEPISIGGNSINFEGRALPVLKPLDIKSLVSANVTNIDQMVSLRDKFLDEVYRDVKTSGTPAQRKFLDSHAQSQAEAAAMGDSLGALVTDVNANDATGQAQMAVALIQLNITPLVTMGIPFGGDNHQDNNLVEEVTESNAGIEAIGVLWERLKAANMEDRAIFTSLNTFGRDLVRNNAGGRDHNSRHHAMPIFGPNIKAGVVGGVEPYYRNGNLNDFMATGINSETGLNTGTLDIAFEDTLVSSGKTLAKALGVSDERIAARFDGGKVISGALT